VIAYQRLEQLFEDKSVTKVVTSGKRPVLF